MLFEADAQVGESVGESGGGVVVDEVVRGDEAKLGFFCDAESDGCFGEIKGALVRWPALPVSCNPFSNCRLPHGTTMLELVICGRSVEMEEACALAPHGWAFAWTARVPAMTEHSANVQRDIQRMIAVESGLRRLRHRISDGFV